MKSKSLKYQLNTRIILTISIFIILVFGLSYYSMIALVKNTLEKKMENSIEFVKKFAIQKNKLLSYLTEDSINHRDFYKIARHQVIEIMNMMDFGKNGFIWFSDLSGFIRIHPNENLIDQKIASTELTRYMQAIPKDGQIYNTKIHDSIYYVSYFSLWKLYIILEADYNELFSLVFTLRNWSFIILLGFVILIYFLVRVIAKRISKPIENLSQISTKILNGADAKATQWPQDGCLEVNNLSFTLKTLVEDLYEKNQELFFKNHALSESYQKEQASREELESAYEEMEAAYEELEVTHREIEQTNQKLDVALEKAKEGNKIKEELLSLMSHEIRTPLTGILGFTNLLIKDCQNHPNPNPNGETDNQNIVYLEYILKSATRLNDLLSNLIELSSQISGNKIQLKYEYFNIEEMINDILILFNKNMLDQTNELSYNILCHKIIYSDPLRVQQILYNIIGNALKFTNHGIITIEVTQKETDYLFMVKDTGIGIDPAYHERIFDIFQQIDSSKTRKYQGAGIGLSVCKKFIDVLGGKIWIESNVGKGSIFYFTIPIQDLNLKSPVIENKDKDFLSMNHLKILFAEDDITNYTLFKNILKNTSPKKLNGYKNAKDLIAELRKDPDYHLVLLDIQMPEMNGIECLNEIRKFNQNIPVIAVSAYSLNDERNQFLSYGFNDFISKPYDFDDLKLKINQIIKNQS